MPITVLLVLPSTIDEFWTGQFYSYTNEVKSIFKFPELPFYLELSFQMILG